LVLVLLEKLPEPLRQPWRCPTCHHAGYAALDGKIKWVGRRSEIPPR
jgi:hypothetical protein